jgi:transposase
LQDGNTTRGENLLFGRSKAGVSLIAHILISKYVENLPLHRLIARFARSGLKIPPATMGQWVKTGADPLLILYEAYKKDSVPKSVSVK